MSQRSLRFLPGQRQKRPGSGRLQPFTALYLVVVSYPKEKAEFFSRKLRPSVLTAGCKRRAKCTVFCKAAAPDSRCACWERRSWTEAFFSRAASETIRRLPLVGKLTFVCEGLTAHGASLSHSKHFWQRSFMSLHGS